MRFRHSGKLGDIVYALPALKACGRAELYLHVTRVIGFSSSEAAALLPLLRAQSYVTVAKVWEGEPFDYDLDEFRRVDRPELNLADAHLRVLGLSPVWRDSPWLSVPERTGTIYDVLFARSLVHRGPEGFWQECFRLLGENAQFVGSDSEHQAFCELIGPIARVSTRDLLQVAEAIAGASLFVGNQSCPYAIAEGLKATAIQETCVTANCIFERPNALFVRAASDILGIEAFATEAIRARNSHHTRPRK